jgi:hypothetical protein
MEESGTDEGSESFRMVLKTRALEERREKKVVATRAAC